MGLSWVSTHYEFICFSFQCCSLCSQCISRKDPLSSFGSRSSVLGSTTLLTGGGLRGTCAAQLCRNPFWLWNCSRKKGLDIHCPICPCFTSPLLSILILTHSSHWPLLVSWDCGLGLPHTTRCPAFSAHARQIVGLLGLCNCMSQFL